MGWDIEVGYTGGKYTHMFNKGKIKYAEAYDFLKKEQFPGANFEDSEEGEIIHVGDLGWVSLEDSNVFDIGGAVTPEYVVTNIYILLLMRMEVTIDAPITESQLKETFDETPAQLLVKIKAKLEDAEHKHVKEDLLNKAMSMFIMKG